MRGLVVPGLARPGGAMRCNVVLGMAWQGSLRRGLVVPGMAGPGDARQGMPMLAMARRGGVSVQLRKSNKWISVTALFGGEAVRGEVRPGGAWHEPAWHCAALLGWPVHGWAWQGTGNFPNFYLMKGNRKGKQLTLKCAA